MRNKVSAFPVMRTGHRLRLRFSSAFWFFPRYGGLGGIIYTHDCRMGTDNAEWFLWNLQAVEVKEGAGPTWPNNQVESAKYLCDGYDLHSASDTLTTSCISFTSCTRTMRAPCCTAQATAAAVAQVRSTGAVSLPSGPLDKIAPRNDFLEEPTS